MLPIRDHEPSHRFPFITIGLIIANVAVFLLEMSSPNLEQFIVDWALVPAAVDLGKPFTWYPFVTSQFLHAGIMHILFNMWYLWIFGDNVEARLGHLRYFFFSLAAGVVAALVQYFFLVGSDIPMLGASGAVAGVLGAYWVLFPGHRVDVFWPGFLGVVGRSTLPAGTVLLFWFATQLLNGSASLVGGTAATGGVAWWAHIGGFAFGWIVGRMLRNRVMPTIG